MPIVKVLRAECYGCGCCWPPRCRTGASGAFDGRDITAMLLKRRLAGRRWVFKGRKCYCPACAEKRKGKA